MQDGLIQASNNESLSTDEINSLLEFIGYGSLDAPLWFIGMEESLGKRPGFTNWTAIQELEIRATWNRVMDVRDAHVQLGDHYWLRRNYSQVWKFMVQMARGLLHREANWRDTQRAHEYVIQMLGLSDGETLLGEVMPLPASSIGDWPYAGLFETRDVYWSAVWPKRRKMWCELIQNYQPRFIVAYSKRYWNAYRELLGEDGWESIVDRKIIKKVISPKVWAYLLPFLGQGALRKDDLAAIIE